MQIGERLKVIREAKNMSQGDVEKKTGLLRCYLSRCENGHTVPSIDTLEKWSRALDVSMSQLFAENGQAEKLLPAFKNGRTPKLNRAAANSLRRIGSALTRMSPRDIVLVTSFASKLAARQ
jgi:transcriptional regulator with XRE-family HTH domain